MNKLLLYGPGGLGLQTAHLLKAHFSAEYEVLGFVADKMERGADVFEGLRVLGTFAEVLNTPGLRPSEVCMLPTVGYLHMDERKRVVKVVLDAGYEMPNIVSPSAILDENVELGKGTIIGAGVIVDNHSKVGDCVFMNPGVCIAHDCDIGEGTIMAPGATIGGYVKIGRYSFMGIGCAVVNNLTIGEFVFVDAGSLVVKDIPGFSRYREQRAPQIMSRKDIGDK